MVEGSQKKLTSSAQGLMKKMILTWYLLISFTAASENAAATHHHINTDNEDGITIEEGTTIADKAT